MDLTNENKAGKFRKLFKQQSFTQYYSIRGEIDMLFKSLEEDEIDYLNQMNTVFVRIFSPSSKTVLNNLNTSVDYLTIITIDQDYQGSLSPEEIVAILLHEIGHILNNEVKLEGIESEYVADSFVNEKGYGKWIVSCLEKGIKYKWNGVNRDDYIKRIKNIKDHPIKNIDKIDT